MIYVFGANGQVGKSLQKVCPKHMQTTFLQSKDLDITERISLESFFKKVQSDDVTVNVAAYTAVDNAEDDKEKAFLVNSIAVKNIAQLCKERNATLIHISTDYVFNGDSLLPYEEDDSTDPIGVYGQSKREGEVHIINSGCNYIIIRTAWVFSEYGHNFVKTMRQLINRNEIKVVTDQRGSPTYASDLAEIIYKIINTANVHNKMIYHYSNEGECSWYEFAKEILSDSNVEIHAIPTSEYPTRAKRPKNSLLSKNKIKSALNIKLNIKDVVSIIFQLTRFTEHLVKQDIFLKQHHMHQTHLTLLQKLLLT